MRRIPPIFIISCITISLISPNNALTDPESQPVQCLLRDNPSVTKVIPSHQINDDYCDCLDGSDEPLTSACPGSQFLCRNLGHRPHNIPSSFLNDSFCDCCDGSDEPSGTCTNSCASLRAHAQKDVQRRVHVLKAGLTRRDIYVVRARKAVAVQSNKLIAAKKQLKAVEKTLEGSKVRRDALRSARDVRNAARTPTPAPTEQSHVPTPVPDLKEEEQQQQEHYDYDEAEDFEPADADENSEHEHGVAHDADDATRQHAEQELEDDREQSEEDEFDDDDEEDEEPLVDDNEEEEEEEEEEDDDYDIDDDHFDEEEEDDYDYSEEREEEDDRYEDDEPKSSGKDGGDPVMEKVLEEEKQEEEEEEEATKSVEPVELNIDEECAELTGSSNILARGMRRVQTMLFTRLGKLVPTLSRLGLGVNSDTDDNLDSCVRQAEDGHYKLERQRTQLEDEIKKLEKKASTDYGKDGVLQPLEGSCVKQKVLQYDFEHCAYDLVRQYEHGSAIAILGRFRKLVVKEDGTMVLSYKGGDKCWNGPVRSVDVELLCGEREEVLSVDEPNRCSYLMKFKTPAACREEMLDELKKEMEFDDKGDQVKEEL